MKIAITGPESSGKTTLTKALAETLGWRSSPEYAREYLAITNGTYGFDDLEKIAEGHFDRIKNGDHDIIVDTDFIVMKVWSDVRFGKTAERILELINHNFFDLHIVCMPDIPWEKDPLRENPTDRDILIKKYLEELEAFNKNWICVSGSLEERLTKALREIQNLLHTK